MCILHKPNTTSVCLLLLYIIVQSKSKNQRTNRKHYAYRLVCRPASSNEIRVEKAKKNELTRTPCENKKQMGLRDGGHLTRAKGRNCTHTHTHTNYAAATDFRRGMTATRKNQSRQLYRVSGSWRSVEANRCLYYICML